MRALWISIGIVCTGIGVVGIIMPGLPGTIFIILAGVAFSKGHEGFYKKLKNNKNLGKIIEDFENKRGMPKKAKIMAISTIALFTILGIYMLENMYVLIGYICLGLCGVIFILKQKTYEV